MKMCYSNTKLGGNHVSYITLSCSLFNSNYQAGIIFGREDIIILRIVWTLSKI